MCLTNSILPLLIRHIIIMWHVSSDTNHLLYTSLKLGRAYKKRTTGNAFSSNVVGIRLPNSQDFIINLLKPTGYVMHQQFNIQESYVLPTLYLCVVYLSENKHRILPLTS